MSGRIEDCWNRIGVRGDGSCAELARCGHCRNCPVFSDAASDLLAREISEDELYDGTSEVRPDGEEAELESALIFRIASEWLALATTAFDEVALARPIRSLPHRRGGVLLGVVNLGGELVPCLSLGTIMGLDQDAWPEAAGEEAHRRRLVVLRHAEGRLAFPADEVRTVHTYKASELRDVPTTLSRAGNNYADGVLAWSDRMVGRLDADLLADALARGL
jgi:chemotaxis-related protein WspD